ncbi:hypothetical protein PISMIDRAFT_47765, partial [Pisolithus microcarpus 441]
ILIFVLFKVQEYQYLKVKYVSTVDWEVATNYLRCNPNFHGQPRYDCALIQFSETEAAFVRLIFLFTCQLDRDFQLIRVKAVPRVASIFIPVKSIIRGALLYPDPGRHGEFLVVEHVDGDMFLRM